MADQEKNVPDYVYKCPWTGRHIVPGHKSLIGLGNPPRSPHEPVGVGGVPMQMVPNPDKKTS